MSSLSAKDRVSLCQFTFSDGRRCRTPRTGKNPHFCFDHAQKEARARAAQSLGKDLAYFFSGDYLSACDLSTALGRLIPAVIRGDVKPRVARTIAYMAQTLLQTIHVSQHEYCEAFDTDDWRQSIRNSVKGNHDYLFPPAPKPEQPATIAPAPEESASPQPQQHPVQTPLNCHSSFATHHSPLPQAPQPAQTPPSQPVATAVNRHPERNEGSASSSSPLPQVQQPASAPPSTPPQPATQPIPTLASTPPHPAPVAQPFASLALPLPLRRRLHRTPA